MTPRSATSVTAAAFALLLVAGCGSGGGPDGPGSPGTSGDDWTTGAPRPTAGLAWADRSTGRIHLADGTVLEAGRPVQSFVVAGQGAYAVPREGDDLLEVTADGAEETGQHTRGVSASPDGRYLVYLDTASGETGSGDTPVLQTVVVDLESGDETARTARGMGDPDSDDLTDLYEDASYGVLGLDDDTAWIGPALGKPFSVDLASGQVTGLDVTDLNSGDNPWEAPRVGRDPASGDYNADRTWAISPQRLRDRFVAKDGAVVVPRLDTPTWTLDRWVDDDTAVGFTSDAPPNDAGYRDEQAARWLVTCTVPSGACETVEGSDRGAPQIVLPTPPLS